MLKQIKNLGLGLLVGTMIFTAVPVQGFADEGRIMTPEEFTFHYPDLEEGDELVDEFGHVYNHKGIHVRNQDGSPVKNAPQPIAITTSKKDADIAVNIYEITNWGKCSKEEEKMIRQYIKYRKIRNAAKALYKEHAADEYRDCLEMYKPYDYNIEEIEEEAAKLFDGYYKMSQQRREIINYVFLYQYNKTFNYKNIVNRCEACNKEYITFKLAAMYDKENNCGCKHDIPVPEITFAGIKAAVLRSQYDFRTDNDKVTLVKDENGQITIFHDYDVMCNTKRRMAIYDKTTRTLVNAVTGNPKQN